MDDQVKHVELLGRKHAVTLPGFAEREEIAVFKHECDTKRMSTFATLRRYAAAVGLCTRLGRESGQTLSAHGYDLLSYGGAVYGWLREQGLVPKDVIAPARTCMDDCAANLFPRESEVKAEMGNSGGVAEG